VTIYEGKAHRPYNALALGGQGDHVAGWLSGVEQLIQGGVHLAVDEEAGPQLLDADDRSIGPALVLDSRTRWLDHR
jgi:hypothetical protein